MQYEDGDEEPKITKPQHEGASGLVTIEEE
jgi:hypothetical protein